MYVHQNKNSRSCRIKRRIPFYSNDVIFMYGYFTTSSYEITNKSCSVIRSRRIPYNCPLKVRVIAEYNLCVMINKQPNDTQEFSTSMHTSTLHKKSYGWPLNNYNHNYTFGSSVVKDF